MSFPFVLAHRHDTSFGVKSAWPVDVQAGTRGWDRVFASQRARYRFVGGGRIKVARERNISTSKTNPQASVVEVVGGAWS